MSHVPVPPVGDVEVAGLPVTGSLDFVRDAMAQMCLAEAEIILDADAGGLLDPQVVLGNRRLVDAQAWPRAAYDASVCCLWGRHQSSCAWYHSMVRARPASKSPYAGCQPSSVRSLVESIA